MGITVKRAEHAVGTSNISDEALNEGKYYSAALRTTPFPNYFENPFPDAVDKLAVLTDS